MSRFGRVVVPDLPNRVTHRGNQKAEVLETDEDRRAYLWFFKQHANATG